MLDRVVAPSEVRARPVVIRLTRVNALTPVNGNTTIKTALITQHAPATTLLPHLEKKYFI